MQNSAPSIAALSIGVARAEVDDLVAVTATVQDAESNVDALIYNWTATAGQFVGTGRSVQYRLPKGSAATPVDVTITLEVIERYTDYDQTTGAAITRENRVSKSTASPLRVHDSRAEISTIAVRFLVDYFGNSSISPDMCVSDFSDNCRGKQDELGDVITNRKNFFIISAEAHVVEITFNAGMTSADMNVYCHFHDINFATGKEGDSVGGCLLGAVYEKGRWWLCYSNFDPRQTKQFVTMEEFFRMGLIDRRP